MGGFAAGCALGAIGLSCPAMGLVGNLLLPYVHEPFVMRMANTPFWVMALMAVVGLFLGGVGIVFGFRQRNEGSPILGYLRARPDDPLVASGCRVFVRNGNRMAYFTVETKSGHVIEQVTNATWEPKVAAALATAIPPR